MVDVRELELFVLRHRRRSMKSMVPPVEYTVEDMKHWAKTLVQPRMCPYCRCLLALISEMSIDHKIPLARGGGHRLDNLELICKPCNEKKGVMTAEEYRALLAFLDAELPWVKDDVLRRLRMSGRVCGWRRGRS